MSLVTILIVLLIVGVILSLPRWPYAANWGWGPSGILGVILVLLLILFLTGNLGHVRLN